MRIQKVGCRHHLAPCELHLFKCEEASARRHPEAAAAGLHYRTWLNRKPGSCAVLRIERARLPDTQLALAPIRFGHRPRIESAYLPFDVQCLGAPIDAGFLLANLGCVRNPVLRLHSWHQ